VKGGDDVWGTRARDGTKRRLMSKQATQYLVGFIAGKKVQPREEDFTEHMEKEENLILEKRSSPP